MRRKNRPRFLLLIVAIEWVLIIMTSFSVSAANMAESEAMHVMKEEYSTNRLKGGITVRTMNSDSDSDSTQTTTTGVPIPKKIVHRKHTKAWPVGGVKEMYPEDWLYWTHSQDDCFTKRSQLLGKRKRKRGINAPPSVLVRPAPSPPPSLECPEVEEPSIAPNYDPTVPSPKPTFPWVDPMVPSAAPQDFLPTSDRAPTSVEQSPTSKPPTFPWIDYPDPDAPPPSLLRPTNLTPLPTSQTTTSQPTTPDGGMVDPTLAPSPAVVESVPTTTTAQPTSNNNDGTIPLPPIYKPTQPPTTIPQIPTISPTQQPNLSPAPTSSEESSSATDVPSSPTRQPSLPIATDVPTSPTQQPSSPLTTIVPTSPTSQPSLPLTTNVPSSVSVKEVIPTPDQEVCASIEQQTKPSNLNDDIESNYILYHSGCPVCIYYT